MNNLLVEQARAAYQSRDFANAAQFFAAAKAPGEVAGEIDHLRGNSLMRLRQYRDAVAAYDAALADSAYGHRGALLTNEGKAYLALNDLDHAAACFREATHDNTYPTLYKAQVALGEVLLKQGNVTEAGVAFRQAAIDEANPDPASALTQLASCFIQLGRPQDAIEAYRTALDFAGPTTNQNALYAGLGQACVAASRMDEASDAFAHAVADGTYALSDEEQTDCDRAKQALAVKPAGSGSISGTSGIPAIEADPLDPLGKSGAFMPDPSDTGFFTLSESELIQQDKQNMKVERKRKHTGLKVFLVILLLLALLAGAGAFAYYKGFGIPSQQDAVDTLFSAVSSGGDATAELSDQLSEDQKSLIVSMVPQNATATIENMDQSMSTSTARVVAKLDEGGEQEYTVTFSRDGIGWAISGLELDFHRSE